jgi:hypothetical protein
MFMKIYVIFTSEEAHCLEAIEYYFESKEIELVTDFNQIGSHNDCVVVSHSIIPRLKEFNLSNFTNLYLYHSGNIVLANDEKSLLDLLEDAIKHENWKRVFDVSPLDNEWRRRGEWIQATFWVLTKDMIRKVRHFTTPKRKRNY